MAVIIGTSGSDIIVPGFSSFGVTGGVIAPINTPEEDVIDGGAGADIMDAGDGSDIYLVDDVGDFVAEQFNDFLGGVDEIQSFVSYSINFTFLGDRGFGIENITLLGFNDINATGNSNDNVLIGNFGKNILDGGLGADIMDGGDGDDIYFVDNAGDFVSEVFDDFIGGFDDVVVGQYVALGADNHPAAQTGIRRSIVRITEEITEPRVFGVIRQIGLARSGVDADHRRRGFFGGHSQTA